MKYAQPIGGAVNDPYVDANPGSGIEGSAVPAAAIEQPQREIEAFIVAAGIPPLSGDLTQLLQAFKKLIQKQSANAFTTTGTAPNFTLTPSPALGVYGAGQRFRVKFHAAGAGADQLNVSALGNKALKQYDNKGAKVAAIIAANQLVDVEFDGIDMVLLDPLPPSSGYMHVRDEKPNGTTGGNSVSGSQRRTLNTVLRNTIPGASLASNIITLPAGTYRVFATAPAATQVIHKAFLQNETDATTLFVGTSEDPGADSMTRSIVMGSFTLAVSKNISLFHYISGAAVVGLGAPTSAGLVEVYAEIILTKE